MGNFRVGVIMHSGQRVLTSAFGRLFLPFLLSLWSQWLFLSPFTTLACLPGEWLEAGRDLWQGGRLRVLKPAQCLSLGVCGVGVEGSGLRVLVLSPAEKDARGLEPSELSENSRLARWQSATVERRAGACLLSPGLPWASVRLFRFSPPTRAQVTGKCVCRGRGNTETINLHPTHRHLSCSEMNFGKRLAPNLI